MYTLRVPDGCHVLVMSFSLAQGGLGSGLVAVTHPGVPTDWRRYACDRQDPEECAAFFDDLSHHARSATCDWLDGLGDVFSSQRALF